MADSDVIVVGAGLAGWSRPRAGRRGQRVLLLDRNRSEPGRPGVLVARRAVPRRLARAAPHGRQGLARAGAGRTGWAAPAFDRDDEDHWPRRWARGLRRLRRGREAALAARQGLRWLPGRGLGRARRLRRHRATATRCRASTSPGAPARRGRAVRAPGARRPRRGPGAAFGFRHRVDELIVTDGAVDGVRGAVLEPERGRARRAAARATRSASSSCTRRRCWSPPAASAATTSWCAGTGPTASGTAPGDDDLRRARPRGRADAGHRRGGRRPAGQPRPDVALHRGHPELGPDLGDARHPHPARAVVAVARRARPAPARRRSSPASTRWARCGTSRQHRLRLPWFVLTQKIIEREFALSGSEQNPDLTGKDVRGLARPGAARARPGPVEAFKRHGADFVVADDLHELVARHEQARPTEPLHRPGRRCEREIVARDRELDNPYSKDSQVTAIRNARRYLGDRLVAGRVAAQDPGPQGRPADRGAAEHPHPQDPGRPADRPVEPGPCWRPDGEPVPGPVRGGRGGRLRRRRRARLPVAGGHVPRRLPVLRPAGRAAPSPRRPRSRSS